MPVPKYFNLFPVLPKSRIRYFSSNPAFDIQLPCDNHYDQNVTQQQQPRSNYTFPSHNAPQRGSFKQGDATFYSQIEYHAGNGDFGSLEMLFQLMKRENRTFIEKSFVLIFRAYGKANSPRKAVELFYRMVDEFQCKQTVRSFNSVLNVLIHQGLYQEALEFYHYVINNKRNIVVNTLTFNLVIKALCKSGSVSRAIDVLRDMPVLKCEPDAYTYCTLMDGLCKEDRIDEAVALLDEMQIEGCCPSPETFNVLLNGLCKKGDLARAAKLVDNMFLKGCVPNQVTYNTLIHGLCLNGKLDKVVNLLTRMLSNKLVPNDVTYGTIINGLVKQGKAIEGLHVLFAMEEKGYDANEHAYSVLISGLFREHRSEEAVGLWGKMIQKGRKPNTVVYSALIDGLCQEKKPYEAEEFLLEMIKVGSMPNSFTYSSLIKGFFEVGNSDKAFLVWKNMAEKHGMDNEVCYSVLIHGFCKHGKLKEALMVWKLVLTKGFRPDVVTYSSMIHGLCNVGSTEQGLNLFNEMQCNNDSNSKPDVITYNILLNALCKQNSLSRAIHLLNDMLNQGCDPDSITCNILLSTLREKLNPPQDGRDFLDELVLRLHKRQRIHGASKIVEIMLHNSLHPYASTWEKVVRELCMPKKTLAVIEQCRVELFCWQQVKNHGVLTAVGKKHYCPSCFKVFWLYFSFPYFNPDNVNWLELYYCGLAGIKLNKERIINHANHCRMQSQLPTYAESKICPKDSRVPVCPECHEMDICQQLLEDIKSLLC